jgi:two-component system, LytTR family, response regulator
MNNMFRVLIVDDEKPARERLRNLLRRDARVDLVNCCAGGAEALDAVQDAERAGRSVHVLFLDVQMPELDGFGVISSLVQQRGSENLPVVVFVTAHDEYALRAFEAHAIDYLLKPFSDERFQATLDRAIRHVRGGLAHTLMSQMQTLLGRVAQSAPIDLAQGRPSDDPLAAGPRRKQVLDRIVVKGSHRVRLLPVEQISWIEADGMYVKLHTRDGGVHLHRGLIGALDASLDERRFVRIHRSAIVNIDLVDELRQDAHGDYIVLLRDRTEVRVGRRFRARLQARLGQPL